MCSNRTIAFLGWKSRFERTFPSSLFAEQSTHRTSPDSLSSTPSEPHCPLTQHLHVRRFAVGRLGNRRSANLTRSQEITTTGITIKQATAPLIFANNRGKADKRNRTTAGGMNTGHQQSSSSSDGIVSYRGGVGNGVVRAWGVEVRVSNKERTTASSTHYRQ